MMNGRVVDTNFPLTAKWLPLIRGSSFRNKIPLEECLQEAYILEWRVRQKKLVSKTYQENYFKKGLYRKLVGLNRKRTFRRGVAISDLGFSRFTDTELTEDDMFDRLVQLRPFNELFYEELVTHVVIMLSQLDRVASEICRLRLSLGYDWKKLRRVHFKDISPYKWNKKVKLIKRIVKKEVCDGGRNEGYGWQAGHGERQIEPVVDIR
jgi:hypothetical protein